MGTSAGRGSPSDAAPQQPYYPEPGRVNPARERVASRSPIPRGQPPRRV